MFYIDPNLIFFPRLDPLSQPNLTSKDQLDSERYQHDMYFDERIVKRGPDIVKYFLSAKLKYSYRLYDMKQNHPDFLD